MSRGPLSVQLFLGPGECPWVKQPLLPQIVGAGTSTLWSETTITLPNLGTGQGKETGNHRQKTPQEWPGVIMAESLFRQSWVRVLTLSLDQLSSTLSLDQLSSWASDYFSETQSSAVKWG